MSKQRVRSSSEPKGLAFLAIPEPSFLVPPSGTPLQTRAFTRFVFDLMHQFLYPAPRVKRKEERKRMDTRDTRRRGPATALSTVAAALLIAVLVLFATLRHADAACCHCYGCGFQGCFNAENECAA